MLNDKHGVAAVHKTLEHAQQLCDVRGVQARGGLVQHVYRLTRVALGKLGCKLDSLRFTARQRSRGLPDLDIAKSDVLQRFELAQNARHAVKEGNALLNRHFQYVVDVLALIFDLQGIAVVSLALTYVTSHVNVGQKVHFNASHAVTLAGFAASALDVKGKSARPIPLCLGVLGLREQIADIGKQPRIGRGVGARRSADGALVDANDLVQMLVTLQAIVHAGVRDGVIESVRQYGMNDAVD